MPVQFRRLPASPFLVPAVLDALSKSQYAAVTEIVAGEAEAYCAHRVRQHGGIALTSDSDMLVYDLGGGAVALFKELEYRGSRPGQASSEGCQLLVTKLFKPSQIAQRLGLEGLQRLAFEIKQGSYTKIQSAIQLSLQLPADPAAFAYFLAEYVAKDDANNISEVASSSSACIEFAGCFVDPRLSELLDSVSTSPHSSNLTMYLPFLIDDPLRVSAWAPSLSIRQLLYSSLHFLYSPSPCVRSITEYTRKGQSIGSTEISVLSESDIEVVAKQVISIFHNCSAGNLGWTSRKPWWGFAVNLIMTWYEQEERTPPSRTTIIRVCKGAVSAGVLVWEDVQLLAQIQGVLYSLRMLKQLLRKTAPKDASGPSSLLEIASIIQDLPDLADLMPSRLELTQSVDSGDVDMLDTIDMAMEFPTETSQSQKARQAQNLTKTNDDGFETVSSQKRRKKDSKKLQEVEGSSRLKKSTREDSDQGGNRFSIFSKA